MTKQTQTTISMSGTINNDRRKKKIPDLRRRSDPTQPGTNNLDRIQKAVEQKHKKATTFPHFLVSLFNFVDSRTAS